MTQVEMACQRGIVSQRVSERIALMGWGFLFAYISLIPFYYLQPVQFALDPSSVTVLKYLPLPIIGLLALFSFLGHLLHCFRLRRISVDPYVGFYLAACVFSLVGTIYLTEGALKFAYYPPTGLLLPYLLVSQVGRGELVHKIVRWMVWVSAGVAFYGITVYVTGRDYIWGAMYEAYNPYYSGTQRAASTIGNAVFCGSYLALCLPYGLWAFASQGLSRQKRIYGILGGLILAGLGLTFTRGAWVAGGLACGIYLWPRADIVWNHARRVLTPDRVVLGLTILLLLIPVLEGLGFQGPIHQTWTAFWGRLDQAVRVSTTESFRLAQYKTTWRVLQDHPFLGVGFGTFTRLFEKYKDPSTPSGYQATTTENMYLMVACETGALGLAGILVLLFVLIRAVYRGYRAAPPGPDRELLLASLGSFCGFLFNMATWDALNQPTVRMTFWMFVGLALAQTHILASRNEGRGDRGA